MGNKILSLDLATNTGWALFDTDSPTPIEFGNVVTEFQNFKENIKTYQDYPDCYPWNFVEHAEQHSGKILELVGTKNPDLVVIEESNLGKARFSQKVLEYMHFAVLQKLKGKVKVRMLTQRCWRTEVGAFATEEEKKINQKISYEKRKRRKELEKQGLDPESIKKLCKLPIKIEGKVVGRKKTKHFSVRLTKELFGIELQMQQDDCADALLLGYAMRNIVLRELAQ